MSGSLRSQLASTVFTITMPSRLLSRLRSAASCPKQDCPSPAYSVSPSYRGSTSPLYQEQDFSGSSSREVQSTTVSRTVTESSYTSAELSQWNEVADEVQQSRSEELPPYEERPVLPNLAFYTLYGASAGSPRTKRPDPMCPCAQCYSLR